MARSSEKAMAILSRWTAMKNAEGKPMVDTKRPYLATECDNVKDCNRYVNIVHYTGFNVQILDI